MRYNSLEQFMTSSGGALARGPVAVILAEDLIEIESTLAHHLKLGFETVICLAPKQVDLPSELEKKIHRIDAEVTQSNAFISAINALIPHAKGSWVYFCYNAEYLFYPFCETRSVGEMLSFHAEERRNAMLTYVVDLYASDLNAHPNAVSLDSAMMDKSGYYALSRPDENGHPRDRQLNFYGGLRWRFEEHIPQKRRKIDRVALFRAKEGLKLNDDHTFNDQEYNTYSCPWHHNLTASICSFRTAKALKSNPGSTYDIASFKWHNSTAFEWNSQQLLDLGLMEPGQWF